MNTDVTSVEFRTGDSVVIEAVDWEARAAAVRAALAADELPATDLTEVLSDFRFVDGSARTWSYNGEAWHAWDGQRWTPATPGGPLRLRPFTLELVEDAEPTTAGLATTAGLTTTTAGLTTTTAGLTTTTAGPVTPAESPAAPTAAGGPASAPSGGPTSPVATAAMAQTAPPAPPAAAMTPPYRPTHRAPPSGMAAWSRPDPTLRPEHQLAGGLDVMVVEWQPTGWARIVASNGWSGWVDGRLLVQVPGVAGQPPPPTR